MQKLKKALNSLTKLGKKNTKPVAAKAAKKASAAKKKTAPASKKKAGAATTAKKAAAAPKKATTAKAAAPTTAKKAAAKTGKPAVPAAAKEKGQKAAAKIATPAPAEKKAKKVKEEELKPVTPEPVESAPVQEEEDTEVYLTDAEGRRYCRVRDCDQASAVDGYCRYHYLLLWKKIQVRKKILTEGKLERYIEDLTARYPDKYLEMLKKDLRNEKDFMAAIQELEIDDSGAENEFEEEAQSYLDEVRGMSEGGGADTDRDEY